MLDHSGCHYLSTSSTALALICRRWCSLQVNYLRKVNLNQILRSCARIDVSCGWGAISVLWFAVDAVRTGKLPVVAADFPCDSGCMDAVVIVDATATSKDAQGSDNAILLKADI